MVPVRDKRPKRMIIIYEQEILENDYLNIYLFDSRFLTHHQFGRPSAALGLGGCFFHALRSTFLQLLKIMIYHSGTSGLFLSCLLVTCTVKSRRPLSGMVWLRVSNFGGHESKSMADWKLHAGCVYFAYHRRLKAVLVTAQQAYTVPIPMQNLHTHDRPSSPVEAPCEPGQDTPDLCSHNSHHLILVLLA